MRRQYTEEERAQLVAMVATQGVRVPDAAAQLGVNDSTVYHWIQRAKVQAGATKALPLAKKAEARTTTPRFVQVVRANQEAPARGSTAGSGDPTAALEIHVAGALIRVTSGFDAAVLRAVVGALRGDAS